MDARFAAGFGFVRVVADPLLDCSALDPDTHELWLLQMPVDVRVRLVFGSSCCNPKTSLAVWLQSCTCELNTRLCCLSLESLSQCQEQSLCSLSLLCARAVAVWLALRGAHAAGRRRWRAGHLLR